MHWYWYVQQHVQDAMFKLKILKCLYNALNWTLFLLICFNIQKKFERCSSIFVSVIVYWISMIKSF